MAPLGACDHRVSQLARSLLKNKPVAERFEIYAGGLEVANGFSELLDAIEQRRRFERDNEIRAQLGYPQIKLDEQFLEALTAGVPACAGVAMGVDRLLMLKLRAEDIGLVLPLG